MSANGEHPIRLLYMEDDPAMGQLLKRRLKREGLDVALACDGDEGLRMQALGTYDLLLIDNQMPGRDGMAVLCDLKSRGQLVPTIMVTAAGNEEVALEAMRQGANDYIVKDVDLKFIELLPTIIQRTLRFHLLELDKQRAFAELKASEEKIRRIFEASPDTIVVVNRQGRILECNPIGLSMFGLASVESASQQNWQDLIVPKDQDKALAFADRVILSGSAKHIECLFLKQEGEFLGDVSASVIRDRMNEVSAVIYIVKDTTDRKRLESDLLLAKKLESIGMLAAGIAHEINTPMQYIGNNVSFLQMAYTGMLTLLDKYRKVAPLCCDPLKLEVMNEALQQAEKESKISYLEKEIPRAFSQTQEGISAVVQIVQAMKGFGGYDLHDKEPADLNLALTRTLQVAKNEYKYVADVECQFEELPMVLCFVRELNQVFLNLIVNAAHAIAAVVKDGKERGLIRITTKHEGEMVRIAIEDSGCGISPKNKDRIFDPFFTTKEVGKGSGLGLSIGRSIVVEKHGGSLTVESLSGCGTTFTICLPIHGKDTT